MTLDPADRLFQRDLVASMAKALAAGLIEEDDSQVQKWAKRAEAICIVAANEYGPTVALALLDQARSESYALGPRMLQQIADLLPSQEEPITPGEFS